MSLAIGEADDLVLDRGAIARANALDLPGIHRRAVEIGADQSMARRRGPGNEAADLRDANFIRQKRKRLRRIIARLRLEAGPVDGLAIEPRRRAGLQPPHGKADPVQAVRQADCRRLIDTAARPGIEPAMHHPGQEGAGRHHDTGRVDRAAIPEGQTIDAPAIVEDQIFDPAFDNHEVDIFLQNFLHREAIELAVGLRARAANSGPFRAVQHPELDTGAIDHPGHHAVKRIDFADDVALAEAANRRIARHLTNRGALVGHQRRARADPRRGGRSLAARMPAADDDDVEAIIP